MNQNDLTLMVCTPLTEFIIFSTLYYKQSIYINNTFFPVNRKNWRQFMVCVCVCVCVLTPHNQTLTGVYLCLCGLSHYSSWPLACFLSCCNVAMRLFFPVFPFVFVFQRCFTSGRKMTLTEWTSATEQPQVRAPCSCLSSQNRTVTAVCVCCLFLCFSWTLAYFLSCCNVATS